MAALRHPWTPLLLLACLGPVACGASSTAGLGPVASDAPGADVTLVDAAPPEVGADTPTVADARRADGDTIDVGTADRPSTDLGGADTGGLDTGTPDVSATDINVVDLGSADAAGADVGVVDATAGDAASGADVGADAGMDAPVPADVLLCVGTHPLLDAGARFCGSGQCYCPSPGANGDSCLPTGTAAACCPGRSVTCAGGGDAGPACPTGTHPLVDGGARFCASGSCYCPSSDACRPVAVARMCCPTAVICD